LQIRSTIDTNHGVRTTFIFRFEASFARTGYPLFGHYANPPSHTLNPNIRLYRYSQGEHFGPHYDDSVKDASTGAKSEWTFLIYLTGEAQGVLGEQTVFYRERQGGPTREKIVVPLTRGTALLHRHGYECSLHVGKEVLKGTKYILRSDVMFKR